MTTTIVPVPIDHRLNPFANFAGGAIGGCFLNFVRQPFDTIKVRVQSTDYGDRAQFRGSFDCFRKTFKAEGFRGLYRGLTVMLVLDTPLWAVYFLGASAGQRLWRDQDDRSPSRSSEYFLAGCLGGFFASGVATPAERIKILQQVEQGRHVSAIRVSTELWRCDGVRAFYRGGCATMLREVPSGGAYLATYEWTQHYLVSLTKSKSAPHDAIKANEELNLLATIGAGGVAGVVNCIISIPPDVLKSRIQASPDGKYPKGMRDVLREILTKGGVRSLYRGFTPMVLQAFPGSAACMLGYEMTIHLWKRVCDKR